MHNYSRYAHCLVQNSYIYSRTAKALVWSHGHCGITAGMQSSTVSFDYWNIFREQKLTGRLTKPFMILNAVRTHVRWIKPLFAFMLVWKAFMISYLTAHDGAWTKDTDQTILRSDVKFFLSRLSWEFLPGEVHFWGLRLTFRKRRVWFGGALSKKIWGELHWSSALQSFPCQGQQGMQDRMGFGDSVQMLQSDV